MKKIIDVANRSRARNAEHYQLYSSFLKIITEDLAKRLKIEKPRSRFAASLAKENEAYLQNQKYEGTRFINEANTVCDRYFRALDLAVQYKQLSDNIDEVKAADRISFLMDPYQGAPNKPQAENIAMVKDLVEELESDKYASDVETLELTTLVASLKSSVEVFEDAISGRAGERMARILSDNMKTVRPIVEQDFATLAEYISALYLVTYDIDVDITRSTELEPVIDAVNAEIIRYQDTLARRGIGSSSSLGKEEETPDEGGDSGTEGGDDDDTPIEVQ